MTHLPCCLHVICSNMVELTKAIKYGLLLDGCDQQDHTTLLLIVRLLPEKKLLVYHFHHDHPFYGIAKNWIFQSTYVINLPMI